MPIDILNPLFDNCPDDSCDNNESLGHSIINIPGASCDPPQKVIINYGDGESFDTGNLVEGDNISFTGSGVNRIVGAGNLVINAEIPDLSTYLQEGDNISLLTNDANYITINDIPPVDLSNYYTKTNLQTPGEAAVHWDNITDAPTFSSTLQEVLTAGDTATIGAYFNIPEEASWGASTEIKIGDYGLVNDPDAYSVGIRVTNPVIGFNTDITASGFHVSSAATSTFISPGNITLVNSSGNIVVGINSSGRYFGGTAGNAILQNSAGTIAYLTDIPNMTGYATEQWVEDKNYLTSVPWSFDVNNGDLTINGVTNNLDGRWLEKAEGVITPGYGIIVNGDLATGMGIEVDTDDLDARYLRKDINDNNSTFSLTLGNLISETATISSTLTLSSLAVGSTSDSFLTITSGGIVQKVTLPTGGGPFTVANNSGVSQFTVAPGDTWRFNATGDASIAFNAGTKTITINSSGGSSGGGVDSWNARTGAVVPEAGDYSTTLVDEGTNLYFTQARVRSTPLTGFAVGANTAILATDTVLQAFDKTQGQINARVPTSRTLTVNGTSGNITVSGGTLDLSANRSWTVNLATAGTAGTYTKVTTDAYGRITAGGALTVSDLPSEAIQNLSTGGYEDMGLLGISGGNTVRLGSVYVNGTFGDAQTMLNGLSTSNTGLFPYSHTTGATGFASPVGAGIAMWRYSGATAKSGFLLETSNTNDDLLYYANISGNGILRPWQIIASRAWVNSVLPTDYISTSGNQTGLSGNKTTSGTWTFSGATSVPVIIERTGTNANSSIQYITTSGSIYAGQGTGNSFGVGSTANLAADAWLNVGASGMSYVSSNTNTTAIPNYGFVMTRGTSGAYIAGGGTSARSWALRNYQSSGIQFILDDGGIDIPIGTSNTTPGYYIGGEVVLGGSGNYTLLSSRADGGIVYIYPNGRSNLTGRSIFTESSTTIGSLTGSGTQMVVANASGVLSRQAIPSIPSNIATYNTATYNQLEVGTTWFRTPASGMLPAANGSSALGSSSWNFSNIYGQTLYENNVSLASKYALAARTLTFTQGTGISVTSSGTALNLSANRAWTITNTAPNATHTGDVTGSAALTIATSAVTYAKFQNVPTQTLLGRGAAGTGNVGAVTLGANLSLSTDNVLSATNTNTTYSDGNGLTLSGTVFSLTAINAGSSTIGAVRYNGTSRTAGSWYGGTTSPVSSTRLNYDGIIHAYDFIGYGSSDRQLKENISIISSPIEKLSQINGYGFKWKDGNDNYSGYDYGVIAQEIEKVLPEIVIERGGVKAIKTGNQLTGLLIAGFNELVKRVEALENGLS